MPRGTAATDSVRHCRTDRITLRLAGLAALRAHLFYGGAARERRSTVARLYWKREEPPVPSAWRQ
ncbi:hypothetical protein BGLA2_1390019 [Burkholderia gladioli]|nr:hypothetical protein BGLA2_1390019 [Burkholderia gladioli]